MNNNHRNYARVCCSLHNTEILRLKDLAENQGTTESQVLRQILDRYLKRMERKKLPCKPYQKCENLLSESGVKHIARTITKSQDKRLSIVAGKMGRSVSELVREAVEEYRFFLQNAKYLLY